MVGVAGVWFVVSCLLCWVVCCCLGRLRTACVVCCTCGWVLLGYLFGVLWFVVMQFCWRDLFMGCL